MAGKKRIFSISMVKNEMDIIESFVRYNSNIFDGMIILDNGSSDETLIILDHLKKEKFPIFVFEDDDVEFDKIAKMTFLLKKAVEEFNADIIVPLDADEFIISSHKGNPRKYLEDIGPESYHLALWKTYVPYLGNKENEDFIPARITYCRDENIEKLCVLANSKVIIPRNMLESYNVKIGRGSHRLIYNSKYNNKIKRIHNDHLRVAHFPIRSIEQTISKISVGWINALSSIERKKIHSLHWQKIFNQLKNNEKIEKDDVIKFASEYSLENSDINIELKEDPIDLSFCKNIEIKYTNKKINPMANLLEACEMLSLNYVNLKKDKKRQSIIQNKKMNKLKNRFYEMEYHCNLNRPIIQRLISKFPSLYIFFSQNNGLKNALITIKGYKAIKKNKLFDIGFYLRNNADVRNSGMDPILHYIYHGFDEGRKPSSTFNAIYYLKKYKDVKRSKLNPLIHYSLYGIKEGRKAFKDQEKIKISEKSNAKSLSDLSKKDNIKKKIQPSLGKTNAYKEKIEKKLKKINLKERITISIKVPAPNWKTAHYWGDYHFALALKKEFEKKNHEVFIHLASKWEEKDDADVVLVLRGLIKYDPKPENFNIMWNISHPDKISIDEYNKYDFVFVASNKWKEELEDKLNVPVKSLLQCTDPELFYPEFSEEYKHELLFVGINRQPFRQIIHDLLPTKRDLGLYGKNWKGKVDSKYICGEHIPNIELHKAYSSCKILLNDHWGDMREKGFISNRLFDGLAAGAFIISDKVRGIKEIFGDSVVTYSDSNELDELINYYLVHEDERKDKIKKGRDMVLNNHTFQKRVEQILEILKK